MTDPNPQERAAEYRQIAQEILAEASREPDVKTRDLLESIANTCLRVAARFETIVELPTLPKSMLH